MARGDGQEVWDQGRKEVLLPNGAPQQKRADVRTTAPWMCIYTSYCVSTMPSEKYD